MSVLDREALEQSPLADLHAIASELSIDSYRLLRREQLVTAILARQDGGDASASTHEPPAQQQAAPKPRRRRPRQERAPRTEHAKAEEPAKETVPEAAAPPSDAAADRARFEAQAAKFPDQLLPLSSDDPTVAAIASLTPIGKGSRVAIVGPPRAGKSEALRRLALSLAGEKDVVVQLVLVGVRPEEVSEGQSGPLEPVHALSFAAPTSAQDRAVYEVIDEVRALALDGRDAVVLLDTLDGLHDHAARRALATARNLADGGSVTLIATASEPLGGETTVVSLDAALTAAGQFPALDLSASGTMRPELLVGEEGAQRIAAERDKAAGASSRKRR